jgi:hypothetical protein
MLYRGEGAKPTLSVSYLHRAYDGGAPEFDYGSPTNSFLALASADVKGFHYDANAFLTELVQGPVRRGQFGQSLTISHSFMKRFTLSGEIWHFTQPFLRSNAVGNLWAVSYTARKNLVFDTGFNHEPTSTSTSWEGRKRNCPWRWEPCGILRPTRIHPETDADGYASNDLNQRILE